jgi:hypothetical protein
MSTPRFEAPPTLDVWIHAQRGVDSRTERVDSRTEGVVISRIEIMPMLEARPTLVVGLDITRIFIILKALYVLALIVKVLYLVRRSRSVSQDNLTRAS